MSALLLEEDALPAAPVRVRREPCACGTDIVAIDLPPMYAVAVSVHVRGYPHRVWAYGRGYCDMSGRWVR